MIQDGQSKILEQECKKEPIPSFSCIQVKYQKEIKVCVINQHHPTFKTEVNRVRVTIGGNRLECDRFKSTVPKILIIVKVHLNSLFSTPGAKYVTMDIKDFYYGTPMLEFEYGYLPLEIVPEEIIKKI